MNGARYARAGCFLLAAATLWPGGEMRAGAAKSKNEVNQKLFAAARKDDVLGVRQALGEGASLSAQDWFGPVLNTAAIFGALVVVKYLVEGLGLDPDEACNAYLLSTPLMLAAKKGHEPVVKYLIEKAKVNPNKINKMGKTARQLAGASGAGKTAAYLAVVEQFYATLADPLKMSDFAEKYLPDATSWTAAYQLLHLATPGFVEKFLPLYNSYLDLSSEKPVDPADLYIELLGRCDTARLGGQGNVWLHRCAEMLVFHREKTEVADLQAEKERVKGFREKFKQFLTGLPANRADDIRERLAIILEPAVKKEVETAIIAKIKEISGEDLEDVD